MTLRVFSRLTIGPSTRSLEELTGKDKFPPLSVFYSILHSVAKECDATIVTTSYIYEHGSLDAMKQWFSDVQKEVHVFGPLLPFGYGTITPNGEEGKSVDIEAFLGEMLVRHGKRSVFFVKILSFFFLVPTNFFLRFPLELSIGLQFRDTLTSFSMPSLKKKHHL